MRDIFLLMCILVYSASHAADLDSLHYDTGTFGRDDSKSYSVSTDSASLLKLKVFLSNFKDDTLCKKASQYGFATIDRNTPYVDYFGFTQKGSPNIALYEWHLCFEHNGVMYKGWRGFDPGPDGELRVECVIDEVQLERKEPMVYMCNVMELLHNEKLFSEYAEYCWSKDVCKRFETEEEYQLFLSRNPDNVAYERLNPSLEVREAIIELEYIEDAKAGQYILEAEESTRKFCKDEAVENTACKKRLELIRKELTSHKDWRYQLTEAIIRKEFSEISGGKLVDTQFDHYALSPNQTFTFTPHRVEKNVVRFFDVSCEYLNQQIPKQSARCVLSEQGAFYSQSPDETFAIDETTNVELALWAHREHRKVTVNPSEEWAADTIKRNKKLLSIKIEGTSAIFRYGSGGCWHSVKYQIVGDKPELEFASVENALCI